MVETTGSLAEILGTKLSGSVRRVVSGTQATCKRLNTPPSPVLFLVEASRHSDTTGAASIFASNEVPPGLDEAWLERTRREFVGSGVDLLSGCIRDAFAIRASTGGKDEFIGLRHALFAILNPEHTNGFESVFRLFSEYWGDGSGLSQAISGFCRTHLEQREKSDVWEKIIAKRLPKAKELWPIVIGPQWIAGYRPDDPWRDNIVDRSGAGGEAQAFATMICSRRFRPPMAVGVFGDWGSGKSYFMRLVHNAVAKICPASGQVARNGLEGEPSDFVDQVVQIRFNAWHYADTNLWASLVDHIITELSRWATERGEDSDRIFAQLATGREEVLKAASDLAARKRTEAKAQAELDTAEKVLNEKQQALKALPETWVKASWKSVLSDSESSINEKAQEVARELGLYEGAETDPEKLATLLSAYSDARHSPATRDWLQFLSRHWIAATILIIGVLVGPLAVTTALDTFTLPSQGAGLAGVLGPIVLFAGWAAGVIRRTHAKLVEVHAAVQIEIDNRTTKERDKRLAAERGVEEARKDRAEAKEALAEAAAHLEAAQEEFKDLTSGGRVLKFLRDRVASGEYRKQLGFIATVRRDFEQLSLLMNQDHELGARRDEIETLEQHYEARVKVLIETHEADLDEGDRIALRKTATRLAAPPRRVFERIVLYIDDLDRCPPKQVIMVLQAIHLLLAFPLFVVFVAVDVRWLRAALEKEYEAFSDRLPRENYSDSLLGARDER